MEKKTVALTNFRANLYTLIDRILESGEPLLLERHGHILEVVPKKAKKSKKTAKAKIVNDLSKVKPLKGMLSKPIEWYLASPKIDEWDPGNDLH